ncbi:hypothetical protein [Deinococcus sp. NW-56]|uniref:hypothetical protein n=1 Tax=Deinococcus sp. NW-56 TaxID=2080419 RepID=UPI000CF3B7A1|nr:hypothetical protein [Deinococcus sp. NW-56]
MTVLSGPVGTATPLFPEGLPQAHQLAAWFLDLPPAHPFWPRYLLSVVSLAPVPGLRPATLLYPEAEYELSVLALNPDRNPVAGDPDTWQHLLPVNVVFQFHGTGDEGARQLARRAAEWVVDGRLWVETSDRMGERDRWEMCLRAWAGELREEASG